MTNNYYPIMVDIKDKNCMVIGGGKVAYRKAKGLLEHGAMVSVISPNFTSEFQSIDNDKLRLINKEYSVGDLADVYLLFICTDNRNVNETCLIDAKNKGIMVNMTDDQENCDFIIPSRIVKGDLTVSISTSGKSPTLSRKLKNEIESCLFDGIEEYIDALGIMRNRIKTDIDDIKLRKSILNELVSDKILADYRSGNIKDIHQELHNIYSRYK